MVAVVAKAMPIVAMDYSLVVAGSEDYRTSMLDVVVAKLEVERKHFVPEEEVECTTTKALSEVAGADLAAVQMSLHILRTGQARVQTEPTEDSTEIVVAD
jgi:hypothetical protein